MGTSISVDYDWLITSKAQFNSAVPNVRTKYWAYSITVKPLTLNQQTGGQHPVGLRNNLISISVEAA